MQAFTYPHIAKEDAQTVSNTVQNSLSESASALTNGEDTTYSIISKMLSNLSCLVFDRSCNEKNQIRFLMKREKIFFKENIPAFSVQGKSRSISFWRKIW